MSTLLIRGQVLVLVASIYSLAVRAETAHEQSSSSKHSVEGKDDPTIASLENQRFTKFFFVALLSVVAAIACYQIALQGVRYLRTLVCMGTTSQRYFTRPHKLFASMKQHIFYAPLFSVRHNQEFRLSSAINFGTLPTRFQALFLLGYLGMNASFCAVSIDWSKDRQTVLETLRNRSGVLSIINMLPLVLMAGRNNPLIWILGISFDTYNLLHRWFGRIVVLEALVHTLAWTISTVEKSGWPTVGTALKHSNMILTGLIGTAALVVIFLQSPSAVRHAFYEVFLHLHIALAIVVIIAVWAHLHRCPRERQVLVGVIAAWGFERTMRLVSLVYRNFGQSKTTAMVETLPGDALRITVKLARPFSIVTGHYVYLYMPTVAWWTSHPFSVAWSEEQLDEEDSIQKDEPILQRNSLEPRSSYISLIVRRRTGFTDKLFQRAEAGVHGRIHVNALIEGPYGRQQDLHSYGTVMLFAGGVGITHQVPYVRNLVEGFGNGTVATRKIILVWIIQSPEHLEWIRPWMTTILGMPRRREVLRILLFITRPRSTKEIQSPSATVQMFPGRPNIDTLLRIEVENQIGAMAVTVCGTGTLSDDVRQAVRSRQLKSNIDFIEESFSW
ncbi:ferric-chelate reductase [Xylona heveae TC161]|uniref:Ferric-chelate reductase n=1 Tax=Xylona heveae (strain CBS 132557 / TC161) TaxID=1328760 RepID=A0A165GII4_XYLHT|nr:ferric-chelate reductase [Xylona heveae TC161]KZF22225.1 ferric-chelate reductase [Xylona heveae TC161]